MSKRIVIPTTKIIGWDNINIPTFVKDVWDELASQNKKVFAVGGAVRDLLAGETPQDWDLATNATPSRIKAIFGNKNVIHEDNNSKFGVTFVKSHGRVVEVATFREDITKGRKPMVKFTDDYTQDAKRRDFTINALYLDLRGIVYDPTTVGISHVKKRVLDFVGDANKRILEDPLRVLRGIRFQAKGYTPTASTKRALMKNAKHLQLLRSKVSMERIKEEYLKMMSGNIKEGVQLLVDSGIMELFVPEWTAMVDYDQLTEFHMFKLDKHSVETAIEIQKTTLRNTGKIDKELTFIALMHDIGKPSKQVIKPSGKASYVGHNESGATMIASIFRRFKFSNKSTRRARVLIDNHMILHNIHTMKAMLKLSDRMDDNGIGTSDILWLYKADLYASRREKSYLPDDYTFPRIVVPIKSRSIMDLLASQHGIDYDKKLIGTVQRRIKEFLYEYPNIAEFTLRSKVRDYIRSLNT